MHWSSTRASTQLVRQGYERAEVDGVFTVPDSHRHAAEEAGALVEDDELIVSRTVSAQGRSRAHLGGRTVPAGTLNEIVSPFVTIHGQADQFRLTSTKAQRDLLDSYEGDEHARLLREYQNAWREAIDIKKRLDEALRTADERDNKIDELTEAIEQIDRLGTYEGEDEDFKAFFIASVNSARSRLPMMISLTEDAIIFPFLSTNIVVGQAARLSNIGFNVSLY